MTFIQQIANQLVNNNWDNLSNYVLVFPMDRAKAYFTQQFRQLMLDQHRSTPVVLPRMFTLDGMVNELSELHLADEIRAVCSLYSIYNDHIKTNKNETNIEPLTLDAFYGWGRQLFNDFNSIDMALCDTSRVISNLSDAQLLDELNLDKQTKQNLCQLINSGNSNERVSQFFHLLWQQLPSIYKVFTQQLAESHVGTKGACYRNVINNFDHCKSRFEGKTIVFIGFNYLLPAEREIMRLFHNNHQAIFFWDDDPNFATDPSVYQFIRDNMDMFPNTFSPACPNASLPDITAICTQSCNAQVQYVHKWLSDHFDPTKRTAVVITNESILESVLYTLPDSVSNQVNITKGFPLKSTAIFTEVVQYLSDKNNDRHNDETYANVLQRLSESLSEPPQIADSQTATWQQLLQQEAYGQTILTINRFIALYQEGVLRDVQELRTLRNLLRRALETISLPFHGDSTAPIQIIGVLETRLLDFDQTLVLNVEEGVVPGKSTDRSFIPFDLRKAYHMQTHDEEAKIYAYNFFRLIRRSGDATLMYSEAAGDMSKKSMSRFLMQMLLSKDFNVQKIRLAESAETTDTCSFAFDKKWNCMVREKEFTLPDQTTHKQHILSLSPSALAAYIECPRQFYLKYIEGVQEVEGESMILSPSELGTYFHGAVQHAYTTICNGQIQPNTSVNVKDILDFLNDSEKCESAIVEGFQELIAHYDKYHNPKIGAELYKMDKHKAETEVVRTMLYNVLKYDSEHCEGLRLINLEGEYRRIIKVEGQDILLGGVIDRLDSIVEDGQRYLRILDYKTGSYSSDKMKAGSIDELFKKYDAHYVLQTLLYSSVCAEFPDSINSNGYPIMPQLMYTQKLSADKHLSISNSRILDFATIKDDFNEKLTETIKTILSEPLEDNPWQQTDETNCSKSYCPFHLLCGREKKEFT